MRALKIFLFADSVCQKHYYQHLQICYTIKKDTFGIFHFIVMEIKAQEDEAVHQWYLGRQ